MGPKMRRNLNLKKKKIERNMGRWVSKLEILK
jgi:hypothetical protein